MVQPFETQTPKCDFQMFLVFRCSLYTFGFLVCKRSCVLVLVYSQYPINGLLVHFGLKIALTQAHCQNDTNLNLKTHVLDLPKILFIYHNFL
jgi:hypothetical protein